MLGIILRKLIFFSVLSIVICLGFLEKYFLIDEAMAKSDSKEIEFVVVHKQDSTENMELIKKFGDRIKKRTSGKIKVHVTPFNSLSPSSEIASGGVLRSIVDVYTGKIQMSQVPIERLLFLSPDIDVLGMPKIFRDHEHVRKVLDGKVGDELRQSLLEGSNYRMRGLAFTYSGGWRNIYSTKKIDSLKDLAGLRMLVRGGRMGIDVMHFLDISPVSWFVGRQGFKQAFFDNKLDLEEAEINRVADLIIKKPELVNKIKVILETHHSLFLTLLVVNENFFKSLGEKFQKILREEAQQLAIEERALSIKQETENKKLLLSKGIAISPLSKQDQDNLMAISLKIQNKYKRLLGGYIDEIRSTK
ncbi:MAG: TRAP transporter substrate-binding protein DctP [Bdellovibrionales bacterium]|nr:TRAP transporter substrate-binding protein DctP [Bdellovibrionales bacterium]